MAMPKTTKRNWAYKLIKVDADAPTDSIKGTERCLADLIPSHRSVEQKANLILTAHIAANGEAPKKFEVKDDNGEWFIVTVKLHTDSGRYNFLIQRPAKFIGGGSVEADDEVVKLERDRERKNSENKARNNGPMPVNLD